MLKKCFLFACLLSSLAFVGCYEENTEKIVDDKLEDILDGKCVCENEECLNCQTVVTKCVDGVSIEKKVTLYGYWNGSLSNNTNSSTNECMSMICISDSEAGDHCEPCNCDDDVCTKCTSVIQRCKSDNKMDTRTIVDGYTSDGKHVESDNTVSSDCPTKCTQDSRKEATCE